MVIRIQWRAPEVTGLAWPQLALAVGSLLAPLALLAFTVSFWAFAAELERSNAFLFSRTLFAHWQVWLVLAALLVVLGQLLGRYGASENK
jgi:hypothetical protein